MHFSCAAKPQRMGIGLDTISQATSLAKSLQSGGGGGSGTSSQPGTSPGGSATTVSPNIQTEISPQISPVFQQTGTGSQTASTSMIAPGGQSGKGGDAIPSAPFTPQPAAKTPYFPPSSAGSAYPLTSSPYTDPFYKGFDITSYVPPGTTAGQMLEQQHKNDWIKWPVIILGVSAVGFLAYAFAGKGGKRSSIKRRK